MNPHPAGASTRGLLDCLLRTMREMYGIVLYITSNIPHACTLLQVSTPIRAALFILWHAPVNTIPCEHDSNLQHNNRCRHVPDEDCMRSIRVPPDRLQVRLPLVQ